MTRQVKEASDIVAVVGSYLSLQPAGNMYKAICPFHNDTRPSLTIDPKWQNFRCWSCGKKGDVFTFVSEFEKVSFLEARDILARRAGINLEGSPAENVKRIRLVEATKWAEAEYQKCLFETELGERARVYLGQRKLAGPTVRAFGLGFAPAAGDWLVRQANAARQDLGDLREVGLVSDRNEGRGFYDRFRDRVMFPIRDARGQTVGFGGRILPDSPFADRGPKYYNSSETPLFLKKELLYGLDLARNAGAAEGYLAVVEGYTDVMMAHQHGITHVVATMGTALNEAHVRQLRRFVPKVVLVFDADAGGETGVDRALELFINCDVDLRIAVLPEGFDPCDLLVNQGAEPFRKVLANATDALDFKINHLLEAAGDSVEARHRTADAVLALLALTPDSPNAATQAKRELILTRLVTRIGYGLSQETLYQRLGELREIRRRDATRIQASGPAAMEPAAKAGPADPLERELLQILLADPGLVAEVYVEIRPEELEHPGLQKLLAGLYHLQEMGERPEVDSLRALLDNPPLSAKALELQEVGRVVADRRRALRAVLDGFRDRKRGLLRRQLKDQLTVAPSHEAALDLLRKLQARASGLDPQSGGQSP